MCGTTLITQQYAIPYAIVILIGNECNLLLNAKVICVMYVNAMYNLLATCDRLVEIAIILGKCSVNSSLECRGGLQCPKKRARTPCE